MKKLYTVLCFAIVFVACQKEYDPGPIDPGTGNGIDTTTNPGTGSDSNQTPASLTGTWYFISMAGQSQSTVELNFDGTNTKSVSLFNYTTTANQGTITFNNTAVTTEDISYSYAGTLKSYIYQNNVLTDSIQTPLTSSVPASNASSDYKLIGSDSIYISNGFVSTPGSDGATAAAPSGGKYIINGNILTLTQSLDTTYSQVISGVTNNVHQQASAVITLKKQ